MWSEKTSSINNSVHMSSLRLLRFLHHFTSMDGITLHNFRGLDDSQQKQQKNRNCQVLFNPASAEKNSSSEMGAPTERLTELPCHLLLRGRAGVQKKCGLRGEMATENDDCREYSTATF